MFNRFPFVALFAAAISLVGCSSDTSIGAPNGDLHTVPWSLHLDRSAILMSMIAPYDTIQLTATAFTADGKPLQGAPPITFTTQDVALSLTKTGLVTAESPVTQAKVLATLTWNGVTLHDTATIVITADAPSAHLRSLHFVPPAVDDPTTLRMNPFLGSVRFFEVEALDENGAPIAGVPVVVTVADPTLVIAPTFVQTPDPLSVDIGPSYRQGSTTVYATSTLYGVTARDSITVTVGYPDAALAIVGSRKLGTGASVATFMTPEIVIRAGGTVFWAATADFPIDVIFDNPSAAVAAQFCLDIPGICAFEAGNIARFPIQDDPYSGARARQFNNVGTYTYHSTSGETGRVVVR